MGELNPGIARRAKAGNLECGDRCGHWSDPAGITLAIADGLGSGSEAARAAEAALAYLDEHLGESLPRIFSGCDRALRSTRGVAMGIACFDRESGSLDYAAVGNTRALLLRSRDGARIFLSASPGIVGGGFRHLNNQTRAVAAGDRLILCTDGIAPKLDLSDFSGAADLEPQVLADAILRDWGLERDDAAALVYEVVRAITPHPSD